MVIAKVQSFFNSFLSINFLQYRAIQAQLKMAISKPYNGLYLKRYEWYFYCGDDKIKHQIEERFNV